MEVSFPEQIKPPAQGELLLAQGASIITLREQGGALESIGRTLRVRYSLPSTAEHCRYVVAWQCGAHPFFHLGYYGADLQRAAGSAQ